MTPFGSEPAFLLEVIVEAPVPLDKDTGGPVRLVRITGGKISGGLNGQIMPGGADWQTIRPDGTTDIEARYLLELEDGTRIELQSRGMRGPNAAGFWSSIWLRTPASAHDVLNHTQYIGRGRKEPECVRIEVFALPAL